MPVSKVVVINDISRAMGGATGLAMLSVRAFSARNIPVTYVCGDDGQSSELLAAGATILAAGRDRLLDRNRKDAAIRGIYDSATRDMLARLIETEDDPGTIYHVHGWAQILSPSIFDALAPVAHRTYVHAHDMFLACPNGVFMDYPRNQVCQRRPLHLSCLTTNCDKRSYLQKSWRVLREASLYRSFKKTRPWAGIIVIHPDMQPRLARAGYDEAMFRVVRNPAAAFTQNRIAAEDNSGLAFVGRLEQDKGALALAQAAKRTGMPVTFVGDGPLRDAILRELPDATITGWQPRDDIGTWLTGARALVMPSHHPEPFALVIPEAVQSGLPVAVAATALMAPEIERAGLGVTFDAFDAASFDQALITLRDMDAGQLREISKRGVSQGKTLANTTESWIDQLLDLYTETLSAD